MSIKILKNNKDTNLRGTYTKETGTTLKVKDLLKLVEDEEVNVEQFMKLFNFEVEGLGGSLDIKTKEDNLPLTGLKIAVGAGHHAGYNVSPADRNYNEGDFVLKVSKELCSLLKKYGAEVLEVRKDGREVSITERNKMVNNFKADFYFDLHTDSMGRVAQDLASGTNVINSIARPNDELALILSSKLAETFNVRNRGLYEKRSNTNRNQDYYGSIRGTTNYKDPSQGCKTYILEPLFHDNINDIKKLMEKDAHIKYAHAVLDSLLLVEGGAK